MKFEQIVSSTICDLQVLIEGIDVPLAVGPISDENFTILSKGYGLINWDYIITERYSAYESFDFCFKLKKVSVNSNILLGAFISSYKMNDEILEIYGIENFSNEEPMKGKMFLYSLFVFFIFMKKIDGKYIRLVDVDVNNDTLRNYYKRFGFIEENQEDLIISLDKLEKYLETMR